VKPRSIGLIVNPRSGLGEKHNLEVARRLVQILGVEHVVTGPGPLGAETIPNAHVLPITMSSGRADSQAIALGAIQENVETLVVVGGDGTMADVAFTINKAGKRCPMMGIGAGSINAGDLVTCKADQLEKLIDADFIVESVGALVAGCNEEVMALAFNDIVIGTTVVGTVDGESVDLDANAFFDGTQIPGEPRPVGTDRSLVTKKGETGTIKVSAGILVGTVVVGFAHYDCFFGKAIVGGVGFSSLIDAPAGCLVCDQPLVRVQLDKQEYASMEPVHSAYVSLADGEVMSVTGMEYPAVLCADGNPLQRLHPTDEVQIRVQPNAVDVLRMANKS
jgi:predicted polyphosphate/ATP-dependent NAD kinase